LSGDNTLIFNGPAPVEEFEHVLSTITYDNQEQNPTPGTRKIRVQCVDAEGGVSDTVIALVDVIPSNLGPVVDLSGSAIHGYDWEDSVNTEGELTPVAHPLATIFDNDSDSLDYCEIRLPGPANPGEGLSFTGPLNRNIDPEWVPGAGVLYLQGPASVNAFDDMIRDLQYVRRANVPYDVVNIQVRCFDEDQNQSNVAVSTLYINHVGRCGATTSTTSESLDFWIHVEVDTTTTTSSPFTYGNLFSTSSSSSSDSTTTTTTTSSSSSSSDSTTSSSSSSDTSSSSSETTPCSETTTSSSST
jgi:hypothetical protein